jgi:hypothetical protein
MVYTFINGNMSIPIIRIELPSTAPLSDKQAAQIILDSEWDSFSGVREKILRVASARLNKTTDSKLFHYRSEESVLYESGRKILQDSFTKNVLRHSFGTACGVAKNEVGVWKIGKYLYIVMKLHSPRPEDIPAQVTDCALRL